MKQNLRAYLLAPPCWKIYLLLITFLYFGVKASATSGTKQTQQESSITVKGIIVDEEGQPMFSVTILEKNKTVQELLIRPNVDTSMTKAPKAAFYFASVTGVDRAFGRILDELRAEGLDKNTIVVFTSDHGETMCSHGLSDPKNSPYTEAMNVPFLIRIPDTQAKVSELLLSSTDIMPTLLGLIQLEKSIPEEVQGKDYSSLLISEKGNIQAPKSLLYFGNLPGERDQNEKVISYFPASRGIKTAQYTMAITMDQSQNKITKVLFFDDQKDPYQMNNLSPEKHSKVFASLCEMMGKQLQEINDPWYQMNVLPHIMKYPNSSIN